MKRDGLEHKIERDFDIAKKKDDEKRRRKELLRIHRVSSRLALSSSVDRLVQDIVELDDRAL
jgi:hypothetical protein